MLVVGCLVSNTNVFLKESKDPLPEVHPNESYLRPGTRKEQRSGSTEFIPLNPLDPLNPYPLIIYSFPTVKTNQFVHGICAMGTSYIRATSTDPDFTYTQIPNFQNGVQMWADRDYITGDVSHNRICQGGIYLQPSQHKVRSSI